MALTIRKMTVGDHGGATELWRASRGVGVTDADSAAGVTSFLRRNPGLSLVALEDERVVGAVLCGHDGRRGYISHLAVAASHRRQGVASQLAERCVGLLRRVGIQKCHVFVFRGNTDSCAYWKDTGWSERGELALFSKFTEGVK